MIPTFAPKWTWPWPFTYLTENLNLDYNLWAIEHRTFKFHLDYNLWAIEHRTFKFHMCLPFDKTFPTIPKYSTLWPWPWSLTYICKNLKLSITLIEVQFSSLTYKLLLKRSFNWYQHLHPNDLDLWPTKQKTLILAITYELLDIKLSNLTYVFLLTRPFQPYQNIWPVTLTFDLL